MTKVKKLLLLIGISMLSIMMTACGGMEKTPQKATAEKKDEIVFANFRDIRDLNPHNYAGEMYAQNILYEGLVKIAPNGEILPSLAESWSISEDGREYTFKLRQNVKFSDGEKFDAHAVEANFRAVLDNKKRHGWMESLKLLKSFTVVDDYTVKFVLEEPYFPFIVELGLIRPLRMISPKAMKNGGTKDGVNAYIGTGPYILVKNTVDQEAVFERNENYWGEKPKVKTVRVKVIADAETRTMALEKGDLDLLFGKNMISADTMNKFAHMKGFVTSMSEPLSTRMMIVNTTKGALQDKAVRKALQHVLDKQAISKSVFEGSELPADTLLSKTVKYMDKEVIIYDYSLEKAAKLLDEAGWKAGSDGKRFKDGKPLTLRLNYNTSSVSEKTISEYFQQQLEKLGVSLIITGEEEQSYRDKMKNGDFEISFNISWGNPYDPQAFFSSMRIPAVYGDWAAQQGIADKKDIDSRIYKAMITTSEKERAELFGYVLERLTDEAVYIPVTYERNRAIHKEALKNVGFEVSAYEVPFYNMNY